MIEELKKSIRDVPDFPKKGIIFKDITTLLMDPGKFRTAVDYMAAPYADRSIDAVVSIEARGFILGSAIAYKLGCALVPIRKKGKLPYKTYEVTYDLEYGTDTLQMHQDAIKPGANVLIVDDLLATGGTAKAAANLVEKAGGVVAGIGFVIELTGSLNGREKLKGYDIFTLLDIPVEE